MLLNAVRLFASVAAVYGLPGWLLWRLLPEPRDPVEGLPFSLGFGLLLVSTVAVTGVGLAGLSIPAHVTLPVVLGASALLTLALGVVAWRRGALRDLRGMRPPTGQTLALLGLTALATGFFLVHFDHDQFAEESCIVRAATAINVDYLSPELLRAANDGAWTPYLEEAAAARQPGANPFLLHNQGQRLGPGVLLAPAVALLGAFGYRFAYALQGLLLPMLGFVLGRRVIGRAWAGWAVAGLLAFSPWALGRQALDENFLALPFGTLALALLIRERPAPAAAGAVLSLFLGIRPEAVLALPAILAYVALEPRFPRGSNLRLLGALAAVGLPYLVLHGSLLAAAGTPFQGALNRPLAPHRFLGLDFELPVLLNWPFVPEPLRSPYNGWPTLAAVPLDVVHHLGLGLAAMLPGGLWLLRRRDRRTAWLLAGWFLPFLAMLMVQSNWVEPNKMGIVATVLTPLVLWTVAGLAFVASREVRPWKRFALPAVTAGALLGGSLALGGWQAPVDERVFLAPPTYAARVMPAHIPTHTPEEPAYVDWDRERLGPRLLPEVEGARFHPALVALRLRQLADLLEHPSIRDFEGPPNSYVAKLAMGEGYSVIPESTFRATEGGDPGFHLGSAASGGVPRTFTLNLVASPLLAERPLEADCSASATVLETDGPTIRLVNGLRVPWSREPMNLLVFRDRFGTVHALLLPFTPASFKVPAWLSFDVADASAAPGLQACLRLPTGTPILLVEYRSYMPGRAMERWAVIDEGDIWLSDALPMMP